MSGTLYLCATPIGNLEDMTFRAVRILQEVDLIAAEDTRNSVKLLNHFDIHTPMTSYHEYNKYDKGRKLVDKMLEGSSIALALAFIQILQPRKLEDCLISIYLIFQSQSRLLSN